MVILKPLCKFNIELIIVNHDVTGYINNNGGILRKNKERKQSRCIEWCIE